MVNTVVLGAGSFTLAGPVAFGMSTGGAVGSALITDGNFVDNFFAAAPMSYASSIVFSGNYYSEGSFWNTWIPRVGNLAGGYSAYALIDENKETIKRRLKRNKNLFYTAAGITWGCLMTGLCP